MKKTLIFAAVATAGMVAAPSAQAALAADASLLMGPQTETCPYNLGTPPACLAGAPVPQSNYFAMDNDGSGVFDDAERVALAGGTDGGIVLGASQTGTTTVVGDAGSIDLTWGFFGNPGNHTQAGTLSVSSATGNAATINMTGWTVIWGAPQGPIDMGGGADAIVSCGVDCAAGDSFVLDYTAVVPTGAFAGVAYQLHMSGTVGGGAPAIPVPAAVWLFGSGLLGLVGVARRRKAA